LAVPEPTEAEVSAVFEEVAAHDAVMAPIAATLDISISITTNDIAISVIAVVEALVATA
jgi:hypothetical protein